MRFSGATKGLQKEDERVSNSSLPEELNAHWVQTLRRAKNIIEN